MLSSLIVSQPRRSMEFAEDRSCMDTITAPVKVTAPLEIPEKERSELTRITDAIRPAASLSASDRSGRINKIAFFRSSAMPLPKFCVSEGIRLLPESGTSGAENSAAEAGRHNNRTSNIEAISLVIGLRSSP